MNRIHKLVTFPALALCAFSASALGQWSLDTIWTLSPGDRDYLTTTDHQRGLAYNPTTNNLLLVDRSPGSGGLGVMVINAATGAHVGSLSLGTDVISGGNFPLSKIGVGTDGAIYAANLTTDTAGAPGDYRIYRWANEAATPELVYSGDPSNGGSAAFHAWTRRWGDTLDVRGGGTGTQILAGARNDPYASVFTTTDGVNLTANELLTDLNTGGSGHWYNGIAFGDGDTFWGDSVGRDLVRMGFDLGSNSAETLNVFGSGEFPHAVGPVDFDPVNSLLAGLRTGASPAPQEVFLYSWDQSGNVWAQNAEGEYMFPTQNGNGNASGEVVFSPDGSMLWVLGTNNGIMAFNVIPEPSTYALIFGLAMGGLLIARRVRRRVF